MDVLILGAGVRSAAHSALRVGLRPTCADLFGDWDLASACPATRIEPADYPDGLLAYAEKLAPTDWLYTGALENRPDLVAAITRRHRLLGMPEAQLRLARDPVHLVEVVHAAGLAAPEVRLDPANLPRDGSWLAKPLASAGGRGIRPWHAGSKSAHRPTYYQRRIDGLPLAALFLGDGGSARLAGVTRQYLGRAGKRFAYRGSLGPWPLEAEAHRRVERLGETLASALGLVGIFGVDLILQDAEPWMIELNPRYTASVEVLEWALGRSLLADHLHAFGDRLEVKAHPEPGAECVGKAILSADQPLVWPALELAAPFDPTRFPEIADIPRPGTAFRKGEPVVTVLARGDSIRSTHRALAGRIRDWRRRLRSWAAPAIKPGC